MISIIHKISEKSKSLRDRYSYGSWYAKNRFIFLRTGLLVLGGVVCFLLGVVSTTKPIDSTIEIQYPDLALPRAVYVPADQRQVYVMTKGLPLETSVENSPTSANQNILGSFVASKNGAKFYPINCKSASRIKPENQIFFATETEAISRGYELSDQCTNSQ